MMELETIFETISIHSILTRVITRKNLIAFIQGLISFGYELVYNDPIIWKIYISKNITSVINTQDGFGSYIILWPFKLYYENVRKCYLFHSRDDYKNAMFQCESLKKWCFGRPKRITSHSSQNSVTFIFPPLPYTHFLPRSVGALASRGKNVKQGRMIQSHAWSCPYKAAAIIHRLVHSLRALVGCL